MCELGERAVRQNNLCEHDARLKEGKVLSGL